MEITYEMIVEVIKTLLQPTVLISAAGIVISLFASYCPKFNVWYASHSDTWKPLVMFISVTIIVVIVGVVSFTKIMIIVPATTEGFVILLYSWIMALVSNQTTYKLSPQTHQVKLVKAKVKAEPGVG